MIKFDCKFDKNYNIEGEFNCNASLVSGLLSNPQQAVYGEFGTPENYEISLRGVSHIIDEIIPKNGKVKIKGRILNTSSGVQLRRLIDDGVGSCFCFYLRYTKNSNGSVQKIFTFDIDSVEKYTDPLEVLRSERKLKLNVLKDIWKK